MQGHHFLVSHPPLPEAGPLPADLASSISEAPEADDNQDGDDAEESEEETSSSTSSPSVPAEDASVDKKRNRVEEFASSSSAAVDKASVPAEDEEYFDLLASQVFFIRVLQLRFSCLVSVVLLISFFASCRDDEEPSKAATATPSIPPAVDDEPLAQEVAPRVTRASVKKVPIPRNPKRLKKAKEPEVSLEAHESSASLMM
jgi:hypothetical protein